MNHERSVAIYGGSFNPPTSAHETIVRACLDVNFIDEVWLMPSGVRADKDFETTDAQRLEMLNIVCRSEFSRSPVTVSTLEFTLPRPTQTWRTVRALKQQHPDTDFWFVYGADAYRDMPNWEGGERLQRDIATLVIPRDGLDVPESPTVKKIHAAITDGVSSTEVRVRAGDGLSIDTLVCSGVASYIYEHGLYQLVGDSVK